MITKLHAFAAGVVLYEFLSCRTRATMLANSLWLDILSSEAVAGT